MATSARHAQLGLGAVCVMFLLTLGIMAAKSAEARRESGTPAADFTLSSAHGKVVSLSSFRGRTVILIFSSIHSKTGGEYVDRFMALARQYAGDSRVQVLCVDTPLRDREPATAAELRVYKDVIGQNCPMLADDGRVANLYGITAVPTVCVIDALGQIRYRGAFDDNRTTSLVHNHYAEDALASVLESRPVGRIFTQAFGCPTRLPK